MDQHLVTVSKIAMDMWPLAEGGARPVKCPEYEIVNLWVWLFPESCSLQLLPHFPQWPAAGTRKVSEFCSPGFQSSCTPMLTLRRSPPETPRRYSLPTLVFAHCRKRSSAMTSSTLGDPKGNRDKARVYLHRDKSGNIINVVKIDLDISVLSDQVTLENKSWF